MKVDKKLELIYFRQILWLSNLRIQRYQETQPPNAACCHEHMEVCNNCIKNENVFILLLTSAAMPYFSVQLWTQKSYLSRNQVDEYYRLGQDEQDAWLNIRKINIKSQQL